MVDNPALSTTGERTTDDAFGDFNAGFTDEDKDAWKKEDAEREKRSLTSSDLVEMSGTDMDSITAGSFAAEAAWRLGTASPQYMCEFCGEMIYIAHHADDMAEYRRVEGNQAHPNCAQVRILRGEDGMGADVRPDMPAPAEQGLLPAIVDDDDDDDPGAWDGWSP
ncbi:hypothetical protein JL721_12183 [Aureococcus anophagefferens]|nr:hypothetical protein JL721_12183 [Aureococcus anophagefferens]